MISTISLAAPDFSGLSAIWTVSLMVILEGPANRAGALGRRWIVHEQDRRPLTLCHGMRRIGRRGSIHGAAFALSSPNVARRPALVAPPARAGGDGGVGDQFRGHQMGAGGLPAAHLRGAAVHLRGAAGGVLPETAGGQVAQPRALWRGDRGRPVRRALPRHDPVDLARPGLAGGAGAGVL